MQIHIGSGIGAGPTTLAAFDAALLDAGVANYNLLKLSSIIPAKTRIVDHGGHINNPLPGDWGDRLYVVMAEMRVDTPNEEAWAGIGWVQDRKTGRGLFVEHEGYSEQSVRRDIKQTLQTMMDARQIDFGPVRMCVAGTVCKQKPAAAVAIAVYQASDWKNAPFFFSQLEG